jgi:archaemetzincin
LGGRASIVALNRLGEDLSPKPLHCKDKACIMHYCRKISDVDRKSGELCRYCKVLMGDEVKRLAGG